MIEVIQRVRKKSGNMYSSVMKYMVLIFLNWDSLHARLNSHYKAWGYKKKKHKKMKHTENLFRKILQLIGIC